MIEIRINGEVLTLPSGTSLETALHQYLNDGQQKLSYAVALNSEFVANGEYATTPLKSNDSIDVLFPIFGG